MSDTGEKIQELVKRISDLESKLAQVIAERDAYKENAIELQEELDEANAWLP